MRALAVRHKQVELLQALVEVNQCKADAHGDQPVIRGAEFLEGVLQVQQDASCWEGRGGGPLGRAGGRAGVCVDLGRWVTAQALVSTLLSTCCCDWPTHT